MELNEQRRAYQDGYRSGSADRRLSIRSDVSATSFSTDTDYVRAYCQGYRAGNAGMLPRFSDEVRL